LDVSLAMRPIVLPAQKECILILLIHYVRIVLIKLVIASIVLHQPNATIAPLATILLLQLFVHHAHHYLDAYLVHLQ